MFYFTFNKQGLVLLYKIQMFHVQRKPSFAKLDQRLNPTKSQPWAASPSLFVKAQELLLGPILLHLFLVDVLWGDWLLLKTVNFIVIINAQILFPEFVRDRVDFIQFQQRRLLLRFLVLVQDEMPVSTRMWVWCLHLIRLPVWLYEAWFVNVLLFHKISSLVYQINYIPENINILYLWWVD